VAAAIADLPKGGGTVMISSALAGSPSSSGLSIPSGVALVFEPGTFILGGPIRVTGTANEVRGMMGGTVLRFQATDGIVIPDTKDVEKTISIEGLELQAARGNSDAAIRMDAPKNALTHVTVRNLRVTGAAGGKWAFVVHMNNAQMSSFYDLYAPFGGWTVGVHAENSSNEDNFYHCFFFGSSGATRAVEAFDGPINSSEIYFHGGGLQGSFLNSIMFNSKSNIFAEGVHFEGTMKSPKDGADIVVDSGFLALSHSDSPSILTKKSYSSFPTLELFGNSLGNPTNGGITVNGSTMGLVAGNNIHSV
jgi:hypothetical protein